MPEIASFLSAGNMYNMYLVELCLSLLSLLVDILRTYCLDMSQSRQKLPLKTAFQKGIRHKKAF